MDALGEILGIENVPAMMPNKKTMMENRDEIFKTLQEALLKNTTAYWLEELQKAGIWCGKVNDYEDVVKDPQVIYNQMIQTISHPIAGEVQVVNCPIEFSKTPVSIRRVPPLLGEHNEEILKELGYTEEKIETLKREGIF